MIQTYPYEAKRSALMHSHWQQTSMGVLGKILIWVSGQHSVLWLADLATGKWSINISASDSTNSMIPVAVMELWWWPCYQSCFVLQRYPNVLILTTSNVTGAIDLAFVDRADIKQYIGLPSPAAIYKIYMSCITELMKKGIIYPPQQVCSLHSRPVPSTTGLFPPQQACTLHNRYVPLYRTCIFPPQQVCALHNMSAPSTTGLSLTQQVYLPKNW